MHKLNKTEISADVVKWLNKKTLTSNHRIVLLEGFSYMLIKLKRQGTARIYEEGLFHQRFWRSLDRTLNYNLYTTYKKKRMPVALYQFYFTVSFEEGFIEVKDGLAKVTEKGNGFLKKPYQEQLDFLLNKIW
jgi:hypothetical protein